jgi:hypothetical protein
MALAKQLTLLRWSSFTLVMTAASFVPYSVVSLISVLDNWHGVVQYFAFALAGLLQGALIGFGQALSLRKTAVAVPGKKWVLVTALGMGALWMIALIPGFFFTPDFGNFVVAIVAAVVVMVVLAVFPYVQTRILRYRIRGAWRWIPITAGSWLIGGLVFGLFALLTRGEDVNVFRAIFVTTLGGTLALLAVTLLQGYGMIYLSRDAIAHPRWGNILPDTPRVNAAKRQVGKVTQKAQAKAKIAGTAAKKKAAAATGVAKKQAGVVASSAKQKATSAASKATGKAAKKR